MNILFFYPDNERSISLSSLMIAFKQQGHQVTLLTMRPPGALHEDVQTHGVQIATYSVRKTISPLFFLKHIYHLIAFARRNKIDVIYSHVQQANFIAALAQPFVNSRVILCRHHSDCAFIENNKNEKRMDRIINYLGKEFIVPSEKVLKQMVETEGVQNKKIHLIRYAYDFTAYNQPDPKAIKKIRKTYAARLILVKAARLIPEKRHLALFEVIAQLVQEGYDIKLLALSEGPLRQTLERYIAEHGLQNNIFMLGYRTDVINYLAAADLIVHVSESEASNSIVKESGLVERPILVCGNVGDFDEYLVDGVNSMIIPKANFADALRSKLKRIYSDPSHTEVMGRNLHDTIIQRFSIEHIIKQYEFFHN